DHLITLREWDGLKAKRFRPIASRLRLSMRMGASVGLRPPIRSFRLTANWLRFPRTAPADRRCGVLRSERQALQEGFEEDRVSARSAPRLALPAKILRSHTLPSDLKQNPAKAGFSSSI
ncbi:MAG: hypothetical protein J0G37_01305, partial [Afipia sp.]|nr:hypothetical protein [Afipia sp.]